MLLPREFAPHWRLATRRGLFRVQGLSVSLSVRGEPVKLAPYLVYTDIAREIPIREYEGWIAGYRFGIYCCDGISIASSEKNEHESTKTTKFSLGKIQRSLGKRPTIHRYLEKSLRWLFGRKRTVLAKSRVDLRKDPSVPRKKSEESISPSFADETSTGVRILYRFSKTDGPRSQHSLDLPYDAPSLEHRMRRNHTRHAFSMG